jgi:ATP-dependent DNA helicase RecG
MTLEHTLQSLLAQKECEWIEFKRNDADPKAVGEYLSALANSAALHGKDAGWIVWGVDDETRKPVGTTIDPRDRKIGNEPVENWWARQLDPRIDFRFEEAQFDGKRFVVLRIQPALVFPVAFQGAKWIRVGAAKKKLADYPGKEKELWAALAQQSFEDGIARAGVEAAEVLALLDHAALFDLLQQPAPSAPDAVVARLAMEGLVVDGGGGCFDVTNLGAILLARDLSAFERLGRKALRFIRYRGIDRIETEHEKRFMQGYAAGFAEMVRYVGDRSPTNEVLGRAIRREVRMYPDRTVRELLGNALIHQNFALTGTGPMVEMFDDRLEITNPGCPLIDTQRFIDHAPHSRNERLAGLMRRLGICEERGSGYDKAMVAIELAQLPAPDIRVDASHTHVVLFANRDVAKGDKPARIRAVYMHACLRHVACQPMTNTSLRERFGLGEGEYTTVSRFLRETLQAGLIKNADPNSKSRKYARYVPFWA